MAAMISFPFRMTLSGAVATSEEGSVQLYAEQLTQLALTRAGERVGVLDFGCTDPVGELVDQAELISKVQVFGPPVSIISISEKLSADNVLSLDIKFEPSDFAVFGREG